VHIFSPINSTGITSILLPDLGADHFDLQLWDGTAFTAPTVVPADTRIDLPPVTRLRIGVAQLPEEVDLDLGNAEAFPIAVGVAGGGAFEGNLDAFASGQPMELSGQRESSRVDLQWFGGGGPFHVEAAQRVEGPWAVVSTTDSRAATLELSPSLRFFRIRADGPTYSSVVAPGDVSLKVLVHTQNLGDLFGREDEWVGTLGRSLRAEGLALSFASHATGLGLEYMGHLEGIGDTKFVTTGQFVGTRGQSRRLEGFAMRLTGAQAVDYQLFYQCSLAGLGASEILSGPQFCGTRGQSRALEAIRVWIVAK
jgi:hypothetical protein